MPHRETWAVLLRDAGGVQPVDLERLAADRWQLAEVEPAATPDAARAWAEVVRRTARPTAPRVLVALADLHGWDVAAIFSPSEWADVRATAEAG